MTIRDYSSCKDRTFLWKCSSLLKNLYLCPFEYEKLLIKNLIKEMKEQIQKKLCQWVAFIPAQGNKLQSQNSATLCHFSPL